MKKKNFLKKYGNLPVRLFNISLNEGLNFKGTTDDGQQILVNLICFFTKTMPTIYAETDYTVNYIAENLSDFGIEIVMDTVKSPYTISCVIPAN